ncbi:MAG TPA: riboflavin synthase [Bacteroidia bacterium]|nr:riboflavin synthase [Bacteroidia bacterium]
MFTGIIECLGKVIAINQENNNTHFTVEAPFVSELKVDQSIAHNGVCLTVTSLTEKSYTVTAIHETLLKTNLGGLTLGDSINLERCMLLNGRLDGHIVQGHVDQTAVCTSITNQNGSWLITFEHIHTANCITVEKGSITVNGVSLTVVNSKPGEFSVAIIPYTYSHTSFQFLKVGDSVNLEFDIIGKYVAKLAQLQLLTN